jgi:hypothetical protein
MNVTMACPKCPAGSQCIVIGRAGRGLAEVLCDKSLPLGTYNLDELKRLTRTQTDGR